jgi:hypothetical protein
VLEKKIGKDINLDYISSTSAKIRGVEMYLIYIHIYMVLLSTNKRIVMDKKEEKKTKKKNGQVFLVILGVGWGGGIVCLVCLDMLCQRLGTFWFKKGRKKIRKMIKYMVK